VGKLIYSAITSLDGYVADEHGNFDWGEPDGEVHSFINSLQRDVGTHLYGRRLYEVMVAWESLNLQDQPPHMKEFAQIWRSADKIVYSKSLENPTTERTQIERDFDPQAIRGMKASAERDLIVGGPELAAHAFAAKLVDECNLFLAPVVVGGGKPSLPTSLRFDLELRDERRFGSGFVYLGYEIRDRQRAP
jgi:dihydrofolate reductase